MIIKTIYTNNIKVAKDYLIRFAIKQGYQYIDIDNELHIEGNIFRFYDKEILNNDLLDKIIDTEIILNDIEKTRFDLTRLNDCIDYVPAIEKIVIKESIPGIDKKDYLRESRKVKTIIKKRGIK